MPDRHASSARPSSKGQNGVLPGMQEPSASVAVLLPLPLSHPYDYKVPAGMDVQPGDIVLVPLGKREVTGVVWDPPAVEAEAHSTDEKPEMVQERLRPILRRCAVPPMTPILRRFVEWIADYTMAPQGAVLRMALSVPDALQAPRPVLGVRLAEGDPSSGFKWTDARKRVISTAADGIAWSVADLALASGVGSSVVRGLVKAGVLEQVEVSSPRRFDLPDHKLDPPEFWGDQADAVARLKALVESNAFSVHLLDGVTGSGKTEVYLEAVAECLAAGRQALVLLPEIALSGQWLERFRHRFGVAPAQWHSDLTPGQRRTTWRAVAEGEARVVVGARSALFLPYGELGLIVVDEEHESAFKQEDGVCYHARDMAVVRARLGEFPIVLASATPSLETLTNVKNARYGCLKLHRRHGGAELPSIELLDLRRDKPTRIDGLGQSWLAPSLRAAIEETLAAGQQAMLFLNRRGYAPLTLCRTCGHRLRCPHCTAWLVEHRGRNVPSQDSEGLSGDLQCHHCGYRCRRPECCTECGDSDSFAACGPGVERIAEEAAVLFPDARRGVMASDTLTGPNAAAKMVQAVQDGEINLLIGTQVVAKGHHFPDLTLVGVVDADLGLFGGDLRASERSYQLLHQVAGRAGRAEQPGKVVLQTADPDHPVMQALQSGDRDSFFEMESQMRQRSYLPPFGRLAALIISSPVEADADGFCRDLAKRAPGYKGIEILGPAPAPMALLRGRHRRRFLLKTRRDLSPQTVIHEWIAGIRLPSRLRLQIDIDPYSFF
ncbi:primosomal protein N' [Pelagibius sp. Alg239-R121]|uniref:primosomal protein N' n=1 Tax=Pelagibius sp. Alg239-R121 TaxID=2993448 RepID=UPI0024A66E19|nr:primosomal protein N' [Pelagibius sp. Alg239-R121]